MNIILVKKLISIFLKNYFIAPDKIYKNISWRYPKKISQSRHIFIIGAPRSGTTLLQSILSVNKYVYSFEGESAIFTKQNIFDVERYKSIGVEVDVEKLFQESNDVISFFDNLVSASIKEEQIFLEKTPQHINNLDFLVKNFPKSKFIHIHRDGRDCYCSARRFDGIPSGSSIISYAKYWGKCISSRLSVDQDSNVYDFSYERFTENPKKELIALMSFLELEFNEDMLDPQVYSKDKRSKRTEFKKINQPVNKSSVRRWEQELSEEEVQIFNKIAKEQLLMLGYKL